jgi:hypothetical protein
VARSYINYNIRVDNNKRRVVDFKKGEEVLVI